MLTIISAIGSTLISLLIVLFGYAVTLFNLVTILAIETYHVVAPYAIHIYHNITKMTA